MNIAMEIGDLLKSRREEKGLSLDQVSAATSLRIPVLESLEQGMDQALISPIYAKGFFIQYATYLGIDAHEILEDYPGLFSQAVVQEFDYGIGTLEQRSGPKSKKGWFFWALVFLIVGLGYVGYSLFFRLVL